MDLKNIASNFYPAYTWFWNNTITCEGIDRQIDEMYENGDEKGESLSEYVSAMRQIFGEYEISYIDLYENGIPKPITNTGDAYTVDGVHPNDNGYQLIAEKISEHLKKTFIY